VLIDRILEQDSNPFELELIEDVKRLYMGNATVSLVDNVADYYSNFGKPEDNKTEHYFPNIAPPWPIMWFEFRFPKEVLQQKGFIGETDIKRIGLLLIYQQTPNLDQLLNMIGHQLLADGFRKEDTLGKWLYVGFLFYEVEPSTDRPFSIIASPYCFAGFVGKDGQHLRSPDGKLILIKGIKELGDAAMESLYEVDKVTFNLTIPIVFLSLSFTHCKNVTLSTETPSLKIQKKREEKGKYPLFKYHLLNIDPMKKILSTEGQIKSQGVKKALHICRGHFKDFSKGMGLFGKHKGLYWWDMTVKGTQPRLVFKDYQVSTPP
jgi:hypothetical protein